VPHLRRSTIYTSHLPRASAPGLDSFASSGGWGLTVALRSLRAGLRQQGIIVFHSYPALVPQRVQRASEPYRATNQSSRGTRDWIALFTMMIEGVFSMLSRENALMPC
jgi:hypothetical protein